MKLVKEILYERFTNDSDPILDMGIGAISQFKNLMKLFAKVDKKRYIFTIYIRETFIDFWFRHPTVKKLSTDEKKALFKYVKNIINKIGFSSILTNPSIIYNLDDSYPTKLPMIIRSSWQGSVSPTATARSVRLSSDTRLKRRKRMTNTPRTSRGYSKERITEIHV